MGGALTGSLGPDGPGPNGPPWALMGPPWPWMCQALIGLPGPGSVGPAWALMGWALMGPWDLMGWVLICFPGL